MDAVKSIKSILNLEDDSYDSELSVYLELAQTEIIAWSFGKDSTLTELPTWTQPVQIMAVVSGWNQKGRGLYEQLFCQPLWSDQRCRFRSDSGKGHDTERGGWQ